MLDHVWTNTSFIKHVCSSDTASLEKLAGHILGLLISYLTMELMHWPTYLALLTMESITYMDYNNTCMQVKSDDLAIAYNSII